METVSVIIPVYTREKTIQRCLDSVLGQTYQNLEIIVIDDGSRDGTAEILKHYARADHRVTVITKRNTGVSDSRNYGIESAHGAYIQFVDSDDWLAKDATQNLVDAMENDGSDLVVADYYRVKGQRLYQSGAIDMP